MADNRVPFDEAWADLKRKYPETITEAERLAKEMEKKQMSDLISRSALMGTAIWAKMDEVEE